MGSGTPQNVEAAMSKGVVANARDGLGMIALMYAAQSNGNPEIVTTLMRTGADIEAKGSLGGTP